jgi:hypothetical protein
MRHALDERRDLIEQRALAILESATREGQAWVAALGTPPAQPGNAAAWRRHARIVAAYRDRYSIASPTPVDTGDGESTAQRIDAARATAAVNRARDIASVRSKDERPTAAPTPLSRSL